MGSKVSVSSTGPGTAMDFEARECDEYSKAV